MSVEDIKKDYEELMLDYSKPNLEKLLTSIVDHILGNPPKPKQPQEEYVSIMDFCLKYPIGHPNTISSLLSEDSYFFGWCGKKEKHRYCIQPRRALYYLANETTSKSPKLKKRVLELFKQETQKETNGQENGQSH